MRSLPARPSGTRAGESSPPRFDDPDLAFAYWYDRYLTEVPAPSDETRAALQKLRCDEKLVALLGHPSEELRQTTTSLLWSMWRAERGEEREQNLIQAMQLMEQDRTDEAIEVLDTLLAQDPDFTEAYNQRAIARHVLGDSPGAIRDFHEVLQRNEWHFGAWHGLARAYLTLGDVIHAWVALRRALAIQPYSEPNQSLLQDCRARIRRRHAS